MQNYRRMRRFSLLVIAMLLSTASLFARPAYSKPVTVIQPDGSKITLVKHGDEFLSFTTTTDGYTVMKCPDGYYRYADKTSDGQLSATSVQARNPEIRTAEETTFLSARKKMIAPEMTASQKERKESASMLYANVGKQSTTGPRKAVSIWDRINYSNFKGLVILVEFSDRSFSMSNPKDFYQKLTSEANYFDDSKTHYPVNVEGSARDYFRDNSMGIFDPTFDVVGPVKIDMKANAVGGQNVTNSTLATMFKSAMNKVNADVDFSQYDLDNNGYIDIVYFIFAGYGSYVETNDAGYIWPHANDWTGSYLSRMSLGKFDNKYFGRYACSVEIQDFESQAASHQYFDGIGTICHEFSHVLGLADHYDTNSEENGASSKDPGYWDIMANGADFNYGLTPVGYSAFERHVLGFAEPQTLSAAGSYSLNNFGTANEAYILKTGTTDDDFYLENRQKTGWDKYLPGQGLLVWRVETTNANVWKSNIVNANPNHNYLEMVCSTTGNIIDLTSETTPALKSWAGKPAVLDLYDINMVNGVIYFNAGKDMYQSVIEDFESTPLVSSDAQYVDGVYCHWDLSNAVIANVAEEGFGSGQHVGKLLRSGTISSSKAFEKGIRTLKFTVINGPTQNRFGLKISTDGGTTWSYVGSEATIKKSAEQEFEFHNIPAGAMIQFAMRSTVASAVCYIDNIEATFPDNDIPTSIEMVNVNGESISTAIYNLSGQRVGNDYKGIVIKNGKKMIQK